MATFCFCFWKAPSPFVSHVSLSVCVLANGTYVSFVNLCFMAGVVYGYGPNFLLCYLGVLNSSLLCFVVCFVVLLFISGDLVMGLYFGDKLGIYFSGILWLKFISYFKEK